MTVANEHPTALGLVPSFGFGDRLGLATPGHIQALLSSKSGYAPIFAQQSVRENNRTARTPVDVLNIARRSVSNSAWSGQWGADADHIKTAADLEPFIEAGYSFYTIDPGDGVDNAADTDSPETLHKKISPNELARLWEVYSSNQPSGVFGKFNQVSLARAAVKYGASIHHTIQLARKLHQAFERKEDATGRPAFDLEISVDETENPTTPLEHYFIANELTLAGIRFTSLAPRFIGRFEKGIDYIGDLHTLDLEMEKHAAVSALFGTYKISLHSGSDKFSIYPLLAKHWGSKVHVKTAGTSYLEGLRVLANKEKDLFQTILTLALARYEVDKATYHVSADISKLRPLGDLPEALRLDDYREVLHVTFGSVLAKHQTEIVNALNKHADAYADGLRIHFEKHLNLLTSPQRKASEHGA